MQTYKLSLYYLPVGKEQSPPKHAPSIPAGPLLPPGHKTQTSLQESAEYSEIIPRVFVGKEVDPTIRSSKGNGSSSVLVTGTIDAPGEKFKRKPIPPPKPKKLQQHKSKELLGKSRLKLV